LNIDLRIEFCKSKAGADRWHEEVKLLRKEMDRAMRFFKARSSEWSDLVNSHPHNSPHDKAESEGRCAYALEQALQFECMHDRCASLWKDLF
jgi:hypothetical protein